MYIKSINYFRAIAIVFIVYGHCIILVDFNYSSILGSSMFNLTKGGTSLFVFISGFLFHHVFYENFDYKRFMIKRIRYVLFPYLILSSIPIVLLLFRICKSYILSSSNFSNNYEALISFPLFKHYLTGIGNSYIGYWYVPFIMIVFTMSPIFVRFIKLNQKVQVLLTLFLLICSAFMHKGIIENEFSIFQNVLYFTPVYLFGIISSEKRDILYAKFSGKEFYLFSLVAILAIFQVYSGDLGNYHKEPFTYGGIDLMIIQKTVFCLFFMIYLNRFEKYNLKLLKIIAANSFGIYFIHGIVISTMWLLRTRLGISYIANSFIEYFLVATVVFFLSLVITLFVKRILPNYSRYIIGC